MQQWLATFKDNSVLQQYDAMGHEKPFSEVTKKADELKALSIMTSKDKVCTMSLQDTHFSIFVNGSIINFFAHDINPNELDNIKAIYFVREKVDFGVGVSKQIAPSQILFTALGFEANLNGKTIERVLHIYPNGEFVISKK